jgi:hypothetical protein
LGLLLIVGLLLIASGQAARAESPAGPAAMDAWQPLGNPELDTLRGGFVTSDGLKISFGLERVVQIDGALESKTVLNVTDLASPDQQVAYQRSAWDVIQNGTQNSAPVPSTSPIAPGISTFVQNNLNDQLIRIATRVDIRIMDSGVGRLAVSGRLRAAQVGALRR